MNYRSILVQLDDAPLCAARTDAAVRLCRALDAHLVGLAPTGLINLPPSAELASPLAEYAALAWDRLRDRAESTLAHFKEACRRGGLHSFEAVVDERERAESVVHHSHCSDLCVLSQADPSAVDHALARETVEKVVLHAARPVLVLPWANAADTLGTQVMVAWDDSREASRAVADALPFLQRAAKVQVICWNEGVHGQESGELGRRLDALHRWLKRHEVVAEVSVQSTSIDVADAMLSRAADLGTDLIVMGGYGHSRLSERVLGGATRGILASMTVPVLLSH